MSEWRKVTIGELVTLRQGFAINAKSKHYISKEQTSLALLRIADMKSGSKEIFVKEDIPQNFIAKPQDIIYTRTGNVGLVFRNNYGVVHNNCFTVTPNDEWILSRDFLYYLLQSQYFFEKANSLARGAAQPDLPHSLFNSIEISYPSLQVQNKIATILSRYDSLIENYQKQIKLLEESAQRLYKEWFIDFRFPGYENTKIVDGVPEGWEKKKLGDVSKTTSGGTPSRTNNSFYSGSIMWVKTKELCDGFIFNTEEKITEEAIKKSSAKIVPAGSILMAMYGATIGKLGIATKDLTCNQACCVFLISEDNPLRWYIFNWLLQNRNFLISQGKGATQPNLSQDMIKGFELIIPDDKSLRGYNLLINPIYLNIKSLQFQIRHLTEARDRLLPKLMSGEIEV